MNIAISWNKNFCEYQLVEEVIKESGFEVTKFLCPAEYADKLPKGIPISVFKIDWDNVNGEDVTIRYNKWGRPYNAAAFKIRDKQMLEKADAVIYIGAEADHIPCLAKQEGKPLYVSDKRSFVAF